MSAATAAVGAQVEDEPKKASKEPKNRKITQQSLPACKPVLDRTWVIFIFLSIAIVLIPIGVVCVVFGLKPVEIEHRYDQECLPSLADDLRDAFLRANAGNLSQITCNITINITKNMNGPVYLYVELDKYYQNHRRYVRSRSDLQLADASGNQLTSTCKPQEYLNDNSSQLINPCGLTAWSFFNDTYLLEISRSGILPRSPLAVSTLGIAFKSDVKYRFGSQIPTFFNPPGPNRGGDNITKPLDTNERFINWMRLSALPKFRKLWGKIDSNLKAGDVVHVTLTNSYNTYAFGGKKSLVLGNTTWLGGRNPFLGVVYIVTGGLSMLLGLVYTLVVIVRPRPFGDVSSLKPL